MRKEIKDKLGSAFNKFLDDPEFEKGYDKEFKDFALSELLQALMENDGKSVRKLAKLAGVSSATIQNIKSGQGRDMKLSNFINIVKACGYKMQIVKEINI